MGWPFETASWNDVAGAIYPGAGGAMPTIWLFIAIALCVIAIAGGSLHELKAYKRQEKK